MIKNIVIADDEPIFRMDLASTLEEQGFHVVGEASDGYDAIKLCKEFYPDIAILDVKMPIFDGLTASKKILDDNLAGAVILLTAFSDSEFVQKASSIGVTGYLLKPLEERMLKPTIEVAYSSRQNYINSIKKAEQANKKLEDKNLIDRAKNIIAKQNNILEGDAYKKMQKLAMQKRISLVELAKIIIDMDK